MIIEQLCVGAEKVLCYILGCEKTLIGAVIDPGGEADRIIATIATLDLEIRYIINTHCHADHTGANHDLKKKTGAAIIMHEKDAAMLGDQEMLHFFAQLGFAGKLAPPDITVTGGEKLAMGGYILEIIHTPGHSPGGICIVADNNIFTGDSLFVGAAGRVDIPGGDFNTLMYSLEEKIKVLPEDMIVRPGHDYGDTPNSTIGREKKENPYLGGEW